MMQKSKKILILGASSDIGIKVVEHFLKKNWLVIAHFNKVARTRTQGCGINVFN